MLDTEKWIKELSEAKTQKKARKPRFRSSSLPACTVAWVYNNIIKDLPPETESWKVDMFMEMGTAAHTVTQQWLGRLGKLYGYWYCLKCKCKRIGMNSTCKDCGKEMRYNEWIPRNKPNWPSGHIDGLIHTDDGKSYLVLEIKTISSNGIKNVITKPIKKWPVYYRKYWQQVRAYAYMMRELEGFKIAGVCLLFVCRDNTNMKMIVEEYNFERYHKEFKRNVNRYKTSFKIVEEQRFEGIEKYRICKDRMEGEDCMWVGDCFVRDLEKHMRHVYEVYKPEIEND